MLKREVSARPHFQLSCRFGVRKTKMNNTDHVVSRGQAFYINRQHELILVIGFKHYTSASPASIFLFPL